MKDLRKNASNLRGNPPVKITFQLFIPGMFYGVLWLFSTLKNITRLCPCALLQFHMAGQH